MLNKILHIQNKYWKGKKTKTKWKQTTKFNWTAFKLSKLITLKKIIPKIVFILNPRTGNTWWKKSEEWLPGKSGVGAEGGFAEFAWEEVGGNFLGRWKYIES